MIFCRPGKRETRRVTVLLPFLMFCLLLIDSRSAYALSLKQEEKMGQQFAFQGRNQLNMVDDEFAHQYINSLGQYLIRPVAPRRQLRKCFGTPRWNSKNKDIPLGRQISADVRWYGPDLKI